MKLLAWPWCCYVRIVDGGGGSAASVRDILFIDPMAMIVVVMVVNLIAAMGMDGNGGGSATRLLSVQSG